MAKDNLHETPSNSNERLVLHKPFSWHHIDYVTQSHKAKHAEFASLARDISSGVMVALQILEKDRLGEECEDEEGRPLPKILSANDSGCLERMSIAALRMLSDMAESEIEWVRKVAEHRS